MKPNFKSVLDNISPNRKKQIGIAAATVVTVALAVLISKTNKPPAPAATASVKVTVVLISATPIPATPIPATPTLAVPAATDTPTVIDTATDTPTQAASATTGPSATVMPTGTDNSPPTSVISYTPRPSAPLCPDHDDLHDNTVFHTLWDSARGCHYDHEHGQNPFTQAVRDAYPGFDLRALIGGVGVGHTNLSSFLENTLKHGGFDWNVYVPVPHPGQLGFEAATVGLCDVVSEFHNFGNYSIELEGRFHTMLVLAKQCMPDDMADPGTVFTIQGAEYGERCLPYQGITIPYPDNPSDAYDCSFGPYVTTDGVGVHPDPTQGSCRPSLAAVLTGNLNAASKWSNKPTGSGIRPPTSTTLQILFDLRDAYQLFDCSDLVYPFTWRWVCSVAGDGVAYKPQGCKYNNSTTTLHEIAGTIPQSWVTSGAFDVEVDAHGRQRLTGEAWTTRYGTLDPFCTAPSLGRLPGTDCWKIKLQRAYVGKWGGNLCVDKCSVITPANTREGDIYFCGQTVCQETSSGAVPSGWMGPNN